MPAIVRNASLMKDEPDGCDAQKINATSAIVVPLLVPQSVRKSIRSVMMAIAEVEIEVHHRTAASILGMIASLLTKPF